MSLLGRGTVDRIARTVNDQTSSRPVVDSARMPQRASMPQPQAAPQSMTAASTQSESHEVVQQ